MKLNVGGMERPLRIVVGAALAIYFFGFAEGALRWVGLVGLVLLVTGFIRFCPLWMMLGISTHKK